MAAERRGWAGNLSRDRGVSMCLCGAGPGPGGGGLNGWLLLRPEAGGLTSGRSMSI